MLDTCFSAMPAAFGEAMIDKAEGSSLPRSTIPPPPAPSQIALHNMPRFGFEERDSEPARPTCP